MRAACVMVLGVLSVTVAVAGESSENIKTLTGGIRSTWAATGPNCSGGSAYDDGSFENGYRTPFASDARFVHKVAPPFYPARLARICVAWSNVDPAAMSFSALAYDDDGAGGLPASLLGLFASSVSVPTSFADTFVGVDCAPTTIIVGSGSVYVGAGWNAAANTDFFIAADESLGTPKRDIFRSSSGGVSWDTTAIAFPDARALGVRAEWVAVNPNLCVPDSDTLCVSDQPGDNRFKVEIVFSTTSGGGLSGAGKAISLADKGVGRGGLFWFFSPDNPELLIKVLNGCGLNNKFWVFYSAGTDVGLTLTVTDTQTGHTFVRTNTDHHAVDTVQATDGLPCS